MKKLFFSLALFMNLLILPAIVLPAQASALVAPHCNTSMLGLPTWYKYLDVGPDPQGIDDCAINGPTVNNKFDWVRAAGYVGVAVVEALLRIASLVAVGFVIYGGFRLMASQGSPDSAKAARETIINALIGLVVAIAAASIISFIATRLTS